MQWCRRLKLGLLSWLQVRVFPGKTFAFVNYYSTATAAVAQEALDNAHVPAIAGPRGSRPLPSNFRHTSIKLCSRTVLLVGGGI